MFWDTKIRPPRVASDEVVDLPYFDDTFFLETFVLHSMLVFDHVLDVEKLHGALERLARLDGWRKLAARLRKKESGGVEYHIPTEFSEERPAISYTHVDYRIPIGEHPLASRLPKPTKTPGIVGVAEDFKPLYLGPNSPESFDDYAYQDRSVLGLHTISFSDATVVVLHWIHAAFDAMAKKAILEAWVLMLQGRGDEISKPVSYREDRLGGLGTNPTAPHKLADRKMSVLGTIRWVFNNALDLFWRPQETRVLCLPAGFIEGLRATALKELEASASSQQESWVSEGDVLVAWLAKLGTCHISPGQDRTVALSSPFCYRKTFTGSLLPPDQPVLSNAVSFFNVLLPLRDVAGRPLSYTAQATRRAIKEQTTREQIEAHCALVRENEPRKIPPMFGDSSIAVIVHMINYSNWAKADFYHFDFSAASVSGAKGKVTARYIQNTQGPMKFAEIFVIVGKDTLGNYWVSSTRTLQRWLAVDRALARGDFIRGAL